MKKFFLKLYLPWLQIDNNVYSFVSGIFISLATNIFTTLCFEEYIWREQWHYYLSTFMFLIAGALCLYIATKLNGIQSFINTLQAKPEDRKELLIEAVNAKHIQWFLAYFFLFISTILGVLFLGYSYLSNLAPLPSGNVKLN